MAIRTTENGESDGWKVNKIKGEKGDVGNAGKSIRVTAFESGVYYYNGEELADDGICYLDIVADESIALDKSDVKYYVCKESHLSSGDKDELLTDQWEPMETTNPIVTPLILAEKIKADFIDVDSLTAKKLTVRDDNETIVANIGDKTKYGEEQKEYPIYVGGSNPNTAVTKIDENGNIYATGGVIGPLKVASDSFVIYDPDTNLPVAGLFAQGAIASDEDDAEIIFAAAPTPVMTPTGKKAVLNTSKFKVYDSGLVKASNINLDGGSITGQLSFGQYGGILTENYGSEGGISINGSEITVLEGSTHEHVHISGSGIQVKELRTQPHSDDPYALYISKDEISKRTGSGPLDYAV